jgi:hypothetical protein
MSGTDFFTRLQSLRRFNESTAAFMRRLGLGAPLFCYWRDRHLAGRPIRIQEETARKIAQATGVSWVWVLCGEIPAAQAPRIS